MPLVNILADEIFTFRSWNASKFTLFLNEIFKTCIFLGKILQIEKIALFVGKKCQNLNSYSQSGLIFPEYSPIDNTHKNFWIFVDVESLTKICLMRLFQNTLQCIVAMGSHPKKRQNGKSPLPLFHNNFTIIKSL